MHEGHEIDSEWNRLGSTYYERRTLYNWNGWKTGKHGTHRVASARNGGPVAVVPDDNQQIVQACVFNSAGHQLSRIAYDGFNSTLLEFGWTRKQVRTYLFPRATLFGWSCKRVPPSATLLLIIFQLLSPPIFPSIHPCCTQLLVCVHRDGRVLQHDVHGRVVYDSFPLSRHVCHLAPPYVFCDEIKQKSEAF